MPLTTYVARHSIPREAFYNPFHRPQKIFFNQNLVYYYFFSIFVKAFPLLLREWRQNRKEINGSLTRKQLKTKRQPQQSRF
jgi:hypothetical protein